MADNTMIDIMYTVQLADLAGGLMALASRFYGDAGRWYEIYNANRGVIGSDPTMLRTGQQLAVPAAGDGSPAVRVYQVTTGDVYGGLQGIAARLYGDAERWPELYAVNRGVIGDDPRHLQPGQHLVVMG